MGKLAIFQCFQFWLSEFSIQGMQPFLKSWHYWLMMLLFLAETVFAAYYHVLTCNMLLANTIFLMIILFDHGYKLGDEAGPLFYRICGCVAFVGVLFVNFTHALETISVNGHSHGHGEEEDAHEFLNGTESHEGHDHEHEQNFNFIPMPYLFVGLADIAIKSLLLTLGKIPSMGLPIPLKVLMHIIASFVVITYYIIGKFIPESVGESWVWQHADPLTTVALSIIFFVLIIPGFRGLKPYAFADNPVAFKEDEFKAEITALFPDVSCPHIHAYRLWPGRSFEALLHINMQVDKSDPLWSKKAGERYEEVLKQVQSVLKKAGAQRVFMEPRFVDVTENNKHWTPGCRENCFRPNTSCCPTASPTSKREV